MRLRVRHFYRTGRVPDALRQPSSAVLAKFIMPGDNYEPKGFVLTTILGIVGAFVATYLGQSVGWYNPGESAGFIGGVVGAVVVLFVYGLLAGRQGRAT
jgi:uncharacterized membrane protein YeaQ/YmgE (transglycosylase-associated protein family)